MSSNKFDANAAISAVLMALTALASIHCGGSSGGNSGGGGGQTMTATTTTAGDGGAQPTSTSTGAMGDPACASAALCEDLVILDPEVCSAGSGSSGAGGAAPANAATARCILKKLRDRATGYVAVIVDSASPVPCGQTTELVSFGDGSASVSHRRYADLGARADASVRRELKPVSYFEMCLAGDDYAALDCARSLITDTVVAGEACPCRGNKSGTLSGYCSVGQ